MDIEKMDLHELSILHEAIEEFSENVERVFEHAETLDEVKEMIREGNSQEEFIVREAIELKQGIRHLIRFKESEK